jgi:type 1 fimbria pilin
MAPAARAADGTITLNDTLSSTTCTINGGSNHFSVKAKLAAADASQSPAAANLASPPATLSYTASDVSNNAAVTSGSANSSVQYTLVHPLVRQ